jgi:hypothetical protein
MKVFIFFISIVFVFKLNSQYKLTTEDLDLTEFESIIKNDFSKLSEIDDYKDKSGFFILYIDKLES